MLSADFSLGASGLLIDGFDAIGGETLTISEEGDAYTFEASDGWRSPAGGPPAGVEVNGNVLSVDKPLVDALPGGVTVQGAPSTALTVTIGDADFSGLAGPLTVAGAQSVGQQTETELLAPLASGFALASSPSGLTVGNLTVVGDLSLSAFGQITDAPNTQISVTGNATFTSLTATTGGGITLADNLGDRLVVTGATTFDAIDGTDRYAIDIGSGGFTSFGSVSAQGSDVSISEGDPTALGDIDATTLSIDTAGRITTLAGADISVSGDADLTSARERVAGDFDNSGVVDAADEAIWRTGYGATAATIADGDANADGVVNAADYTLWRTNLGRVAGPGGIEITAADTFNVDGLVSLVAREGSLRYDITVDPAVEANFAGITLFGDRTVIQEASGTRLVSVDVGSLEVTSAGSIIDAEDGVAIVAGDATLVAAEDVLMANRGASNQLIVGGFLDAQAGVGRSIDLGVSSNNVTPPEGDPAESTFTAGSLRFNADGGRVRVAEDDGTLFASGLSTAGSLEVASAGSITDADGASIAVTGNATLVAARSVRLADNPTPFFPPDTDRVEIGGLLDITAGSSGSVRLGVALDGTAADATYTAGSIRFDAPAIGSTVAIAEDDGTVFSASAANRAWFLEVLSAGSITDEGGVLTTVEDATLVAGESIVLVDSADLFEVGNAVDLVAGPTGSIDVGVFADGTPADGEFRTLTLRFDAPGGDVRIAEDTSTGALLLESWSDSLGSVLTQPFLPTDHRAASLELYTPRVLIGEDTSGFGDFALRVAGDATLHADSMLLASLDSDVFVVGGEATLYAESGVLRIGSETPTGEGFQASGGLRFSAPLGAEIHENQDTELLSWTDARLPVLSGPRVTASQAGRLELTSSGSITDGEDAVLRITGAGTPTTPITAAFVAAGDIALADDSATNELTVAARVSFIAGANRQIDIGVGSSGAPAAATFNAGGVNFHALDGTVRIAEDSATELVDWLSAPLPAASIGAIPTESLAASLEITSAGDLTDSLDARVRVTGDASSDAAGKLVLADEGAANSLVVEGLAAFAVGAGEDLDVGVVSNDPAQPGDGLPADAVFDAGALQLVAPGGRVRIAEDSGTVLGGSSAAARLVLDSAGAIEDTANASTTITESAELSAAAGAADVVLGDEGANFSLGAPSLFDPDAYLAVAAFNASIQADSAVNLRTAGGAEADRDFGGVFVLDAAGPIAQVGTVQNGVELLRPLTAERVALTSGGAIAFSSIELTADDGPNLQLEAGAPLDLQSDIADVARLDARFPDEAIPASDETDLSPVVVQADLPNGTRPDQPDRSDPGLEDVILGPGPSRLAERAPAGGFLPGQPPAPNQPIDLGDAYSLVVSVVGDATIGAVDDPTGAAANDSTARGVVVTSTGNAYLDTTGDLVFSGAGRFDDAQADTGVTEVEVASMGGGVLTAVAGATLRIDTEEPDQAGAVRRTTKLTSATGAVTSLADADSSGEDGAPGPRLLLDPSTEVAGSATTGLVRADTNFEQRLTVAVGSRGEDNLLIEVEWADVETVREQSVALPSLRPSYVAPPGSGTRPFADLIQTPVESIEPLEATNAETGLTYQELEGGFRVVTIRHNYAQEFVPFNPPQDTLPTTVRVYNDPAINLFDQGGARDLNSASFAIAPRIIRLPTPRFFLVSEPEAPTRLEAEPIRSQPGEPTLAQQRSSDDEGRAAATSQVEVILFGRVDPDTPDGWADGIPGESWPQRWPVAEGDFLREIRELIDEGPFSEGRYRVITQTPRGEQQLEEWVKTDSMETLDAVRDDIDDLPDWRFEPALNDGDTEEPVQGVDAAPAEDDGAILPRRVPLGAVGDDRLSEGPPDASSTAAVVAAAIGVWRRRFAEAGSLQLDETDPRDGRAKRPKRPR